eukprot:m.19241 g.19241  ORF g.19241 m.19241 type:complete len:364 (-) comp6518_c0_seq1:71-1162(-)
MFILFVSLVLLPNDSVNYGHNSVECIAAIKANLNIPLIERIVVVYEVPANGLPQSTTGTTTKDFVNHSYSTFTTTTKNQSRQRVNKEHRSYCRDLIKQVTEHNRTKRDKITCLPVFTQPTYKTLFKLASRKQVHGKNVIIANADVVFDESLENIRFVEKDRAYVLTVNSPIDRSLYKELTGIQCDNLLKNDPYDFRCQTFHSKKNVMAFALSWDAVVFRSPIKPETYNSSEKAGFDLAMFMNRIGAENHMKCGLESAGYEVYNACLWVRLQHFHRCFPKTYDESINAYMDWDRCEFRTFPCDLFKYHAHRQIVLKFKHWSHCKTLFYNNSIKLEKFPPPPAEETSTETPTLATEETTNCTSLT